MSSRSSFIVVGAGVIGCSLADELSRRGHAVALIDAGEAASGTSAATFAWINANSKSPDEYRQLNYLGLQAHERASALGARWFHQTGMLQVAASGDEASQLERNVSNAALPAYGARMLTRSEVLELEPGIDPDVVVAGAVYPREGWLDVPTMCASLLEHSIARGAQYFPFEKVVGLDGSIVRTVAADGTERSHTANAVIIAAGNGTPSIARSAGLDFPLIDPEGNADAAGSPGASVGIISSTGPVAFGPRHFVRATGIAVRPARNGGVTFADHPTGGMWGINDPEIWSVPNLLLERVRRLYPSLREASTESVSLGKRVLPEDGLTIADWIDPANRIYAIGTHSGVTLSAHLATVVADEVTGGGRHESLERFALHRFNSAATHGVKAPAR
ncbi:FAD-binding oxidoreductase [Agrococcus sp. ARC_14]|uniref:NAD(P)/FAD-dependent oxidoreductase n=1 Tax=Agrococcus sp. ARC_14 TaxID=2919927 RepID=UPI001F06F9A4|nr:FAD-binding oxidoreductase [Agrococcus sp. ARC_14]MCH1881929.1 FAD-binding oxidoreductase [Agrococcus sp. ARC_14]